MHKVTLFYLTQNMKKYDSQPDTLLHIKRVNQLLGQFAMELIHRGAIHDESKLHDPEKSLFDELTPLLADCTYGSPEYNAFIEKLKPALQHHYAKNSHHPEHYKNGVNDMNLFDLVEMFLDWKAASERHNDGNINKSIEINEKRFDIDPQLARIFRNTVRVMKW